MKQAVEVHVSGKASGVYKGEWWCIYISNGSGQPDGIAIHREDEGAGKGLILPIQPKLVKAVGDILFGFAQRNDMFDYPCPYICELHINNDGTCRYRTTGADVTSWEDIHHKKDNSVTAYLPYNANGAIKWWQAQEMLLHPSGVNSIVSILKSCGATDIDTEYINKQPYQYAGVYTENMGDGMKITIEWN